jgi:hypothetical protein
MRAEALLKLFDTQEFKKDISLNRQNYGRRISPEGDIELASLSGTANIGHLLLPPYRSTATEALKVEVAVQPLNVHMTEKTALSAIRLGSKDSKRAVNEAVVIIKRQLKGKRGRNGKARPTSGKRKL